MPDRERRASRRFSNEDEEDEGASRRNSRRRVRNDESDDEEKVIPGRRSLRARKAIQDSDEEEAESENDSEDEAAQKTRGKRNGKQDKDDDDEWGEDDDDDDEAEEEDDWKRDAKDVLNVLKRSRQCQEVFFAPVDAEGLGLPDYHDVIKQPMDLGTVTTKLNEGEYENEEDFCQDVMLTFKNAVTYNASDTSVHLLAVQMRKKFKEQWQKARPESGVHDLLDSRELNGRFWKDDQEKEADSSRRITRRSLGESSHEEVGRGRGGSGGGRGRVKSKASGSDSENSGFVEETNKSYRLRERRLQPVVPDDIGSSRRQSKSAGMRDYVRTVNQRFRESSSGVGKPTFDGKRKLKRGSTVVSEGGRRVRVFHTDASESGDDIPSRNAIDPYEPQGARGGGGGGGGDGRGGSYGAGFEGGNDFEGGGGGGKNGKGKDAEIQPINADISTISIDESVNFTSIGGLDGHIRSLKESVFLPLTYPEVFEKLGIKAPGGVLFHGPPGTGKTMMARALANSCSQGERKISFFMRKGADCLSKYHGEAERQLRLLFEQAALKQPSIIFFDEIDGLAPVRSSRQDQIHSSIVSTLLALMDGLDKRGMVVCVGATNRPDAVDPALRRPGRFDREFYFPLPDAAARAKILEIYTKDWKPPLSQKLIHRIAHTCVGFGGADIKALCTEAGIRALRRTYPQIYKHNHRLKLDRDKLFVSEQDILDAMGSIKCSSLRSAPSLGSSLPTCLQESLQPELVRCLEQLTKCFAMAGLACSRERKMLGLDGGALGKRSQMNSAVYAGEQDLHSLTSFRGVDIVHRPKLLLWGRTGDAQGHIARAVLQALDPMPIFGIGMQALYMSTGAGDTKTLEEALVARVAEARNRAPSVLFLPDFQTWMEVASPSLRACLESSIRALPASSSVLLLSFVDISPGRTITDLIGGGHIKVFTSHHLLESPKPALEQRKVFFSPLLKDATIWRKPQTLIEADLPELERDTEMPKWEGPAAPIDPAQQDRNTRNMRGIRMKMREKCLKLFNNRKFKDFQLPVLDQPLPEPVREAYKKCVPHPMDLATLVYEIDRQIVKCIAHFRERIQLIHDNAYKFNGPSGPEEAHSTPSKGRDESESMYTAPDEQEEVLEAGKIIEVEVQDPHTNELEWILGKISQVKTQDDGETIESFTVHLVVKRNHEDGAWTDTYKPADLGKEWRWPTKSSKDEKDLDELLSRQKTNAKICANASALVDESEEELGKIDSWLIEETDRLIKSTGYVLPPPNMDAKGLSAAVSGIKSNQPSRKSSQCTDKVPSRQSDSALTAATPKPHVGEQAQITREGMNADARPPQFAPICVGTKVQVLLGGRLTMPPIPGNTCISAVITNIFNDGFQVISADVGLPMPNWNVMLGFNEEGLLWQRQDNPRQYASYSGAMGGMGMMPGMGPMGGVPVQNLASMQQMSAGMLQGHTMTGGEMMTSMSITGATETPSKKRRLDQVDHSNEQREQVQDISDPALIQDHVEETDPALAEELKLFVNQLVEGDGQDKTWEQLLELHTALYAVLARHEHEKDRFGTLDELRNALHAWRLRSGADRS